MVQIAGWNYRVLQTRQPAGESGNMVMPRNLLLVGERETKSEHACVQRT